MASNRQDADRSLFLRCAARRLRYLWGLLALGFVLGLAYRYHYDPGSERDLTNFLRSGLHGMGIAFASWLLPLGFAASAHSPLGAALRRLPVAAEVLIRSLITGIVLTVVVIGLQAVLYAEPLKFHWLTVDWFTVTLPRVVMLSFAISLVLGVVTEGARLIDGPLLTSLVLGAYHRPAREERIIMFIDIAGSTQLAETLGEVRVHDLITRFFFDIDEPILDHGGAVHAYVGDEVIVTWPVTGKPARDGRSLACFFAIERKMARLAADYEREFAVVPRFRGGLHAGTIVVSECGDTKRQLAYFGDTMNVAARLCEYCKTLDQHLVVSGDLLRHVAVPGDLQLAAGATVALRGRQEPVEAHGVEQAVVMPGGQ
jgi:class 3 adenylate cyclase